MGKSMEKKHEEMLARDPEYVREYSRMEEEFQFVRELIRARMRAGLTQKQVAEKMGTTQSTVARLESGSTMPSFRSLQKYAQATGSKIKISLEE